MNEGLSINEKIVDQLDVLATKLLSGQITRATFLDKVFELDQSDPERKSSIKSTDLLIRPDVSSVFMGFDEEVNFYNIRSISFFHKAQISLSEGNLNVLEDLEQAFLDSSQAGEDFSDWANYVQATIAYIKNDVKALHILSERINLNKELVQNLIKGLKERGYPDYVIDYSRTRN